MKVPLSTRYGFNPRRIEGDSTLYPDHYALVTCFDVRPSIRAKLINAYDGEWLFIFTRKQLEKLYSEWDVDPMDDLEDDIPAEYFYPTDSGDWY